MSEIQKNIAESNNEFKNYPEHLSLLKNEPVLQKAVDIIKMGNNESKFIATLNLNLENIKTTSSTTKDLNKFKQELNYTA